MHLSLLLRLTAASFLLLEGCADTAQIDAAPAAQVLRGEEGAHAPEGDTMEAAPGKKPITPIDSWALQADTSSIGFLGAKITRTHVGGFKTFEGAAQTSGDQPIAASFTVRMPSLWIEAEAPEPGSGAYKLTRHLKSADFFDVDKQPTAQFSSTSIAPSEAAGRYKVVGDLTILGKTNEVAFPATIATKGDVLKAQATFKINRQDWGISYPGMSDDLIKDEVALTMDFTFAK